MNTPRVTEEITLEYTRGDKQILCINTVSERFSTGTSQPEFLAYSRAAYHSFFKVRGLL